MKFAIVESVVTPGGHEIDYDRILVEEITAAGHEVEFYVPEGHEFKWNYGVPVNFLPGKGISYAGARGLKKIWLSAKRELNRQGWYQSMYKHACEKHCDAVIFPSSTYRYLRALHYNNDLLKSPVPIIFIIHGATPQEGIKLFAQAKKVQHIKNIKIAIQTFAKESLQTDAANVHYFSPPTYVPRDIPGRKLEIGEVLKLGFFGQYRKEKNLDAFLDVFVAGNFTRRVKLMVQGATQTQEDADDFTRIIHKYKTFGDRIEFLHKPLIGIEWQKGIDSIDALIMPYSTPRYKYHTSAMLSTAIGFNKPVVIDANVNPEVLREYKIGSSFRSGDMQDLKVVIEDFVNKFDQRTPMYSEALSRANHDFASSKLVAGIIKLGLS